MKNIIFLALILVIKATSVHAQTSFSEVPSFVGNVDDAGDAKIAQNVEQPVHKNLSAAKFDAVAKTSKSAGEPVVSSAFKAKMTDTKEALDYKQKSFANLNSGSNAKRNDIKLALNSYSNNTQF